LPGTSHFSEFANVPLQPTAPATSINSGANNTAGVDFVPRSEWPWERNVQTLSHRFATIPRSY